MPKKGKGLGALIKDKPTKSSSHEKNLDIFRDAVRDAYEDGVLSKDEAQILHTLGNNLDISIEARKDISKQIKAECGHDHIQISDAVFDGDEDIIPTWINKTEPSDDMMDPDEPVFKDETYDFDDEAEEDGAAGSADTPKKDAGKGAGGDEAKPAEAPQTVYCHYCGAQNRLELKGDRLDFSCCECSKPQFTTDAVVEINAHAATCQCSACKRSFVCMDDAKVAFCPWCDEENAL